MHSRRRARASTAPPAKPRRERPFFQLHPHLVVVSPHAPSPTAPDVSKPFLCKWCGWYKRITDHFVGGCCPRWEADAGAIHRATSWSEGPTKSRKARPKFAAPDVGQTFHSVNPERRRRRVSAVASGASADGAGLPVPHGPVPALAGQPARSDAESESASESGSDF